MNPSAALNDPLHNAANPLLTSGPLPAFDAIRPEHVGPAIDVLLAATDQALEAAVSDATPADFDALSRVLSVATERLGCAWGAVSHLKGVADTADLRAAYNEKAQAFTAGLDAHNARVEKHLDKYDAKDKACKNKSYDEADEIAIKKEMAAKP